MGITTLSMPEAALIAVSGLVIVFLMLLCLCGLIILVSRGVRLFGNVTNQGLAAPLPASASMNAPRPAPVVAAPVALIGVDDLTAACIMAIVSDETGISLSQLQFKSIQAL